MELFRIEVGHDHDVEPRNIVGAIANEAGLDAQNIGRIDIRDDHSIVELPTGMPKPIFADLKKAWVCGRKLNIVRVDARGEARESSRGGADQKKKGTETKKKSAAATNKSDAKLKNARAIQRRPVKNGGKKGQRNNKPIS
jgi:ATP-dependent RNA helicase DeaD